MSSRQCSSSGSSQQLSLGLSPWLRHRHSTHVPLTVKMINFWALILVALPLLTSSQGHDIGVCCNMKRSNVSKESTELSKLAVLSANQWRDLYNRIQQEAKSPGFPLAYVCCNQPPTPLPRKPRSGFAPLMSKRGDQYTLLKRFYDDFGHQAQQPDTGRTTDEDDAILSADIAALALTGSNSRSVSRASRQDSLLRRLLDGARTRSVLESLTRDGGDGDSMGMYDYPEKRGTFVRADGSKGHRKRHMHRHRKHRKH
ncbi:uncharacterized protein [Littorina saxatilis]|uniref:uncharacterized protein isoform X3 n=1 Tax=Littorina saxatilis TaxID=31220 RepID=UPI0038B64D8B